MKESARFEAMPSYISYLYAKEDETNMQQTRSLHHHHN